jgi:ATP-binding protein involved in chromosome partitioning
VPLLGQVPMETALREGSDDGVPLVLSHPDAPAARVLRDVAARLAGKPRGLVGMSLSLTPAGR